jgi:hypothetical protein
MSVWPNFLIDGDGRNELLMGGGDQTVYSFELSFQTKGTHATKETSSIRVKASWNFSYPVHSLSPCTYRREVGDSVTLVLVGLQGGCFGAIDAEGRAKEFAHKRLRTKERKQSRPTNIDTEQKTTDNEDSEAEQSEGEGKDVYDVPLVPTDISSPLVRTKGAIALRVTLEGMHAAGLIFLNPKSRGPRDARAQNGKCKQGINAGEELPRTESISSMGTRNK